MSVRKKCACRYRDHRCPHTWVSEQVVHGELLVVRIDEYVAQRGLPGSPHVVPKRDAEKIEQAITNDFKAGREARVEAFKQQLTAGYTKITPQFGLRVYMRDFNKLSRTPAIARNSP